MTLAEAIKRTINGGKSREQIAVETGCTVQAIKNWEAGVFPLRVYCDPLGKALGVHITKVDGGVIVKEVQS